MARAREIQIGRFTPTLTANLSANLDARVGLQWIQPNYTFANPVLGGQLTLGMGGFFGRSSADLAGTLTTTLGPLVSVRSENISSSVTGFGDLYPVAMLKWNHGVHNYMVYATGDIPVGAYDSKRLANLGIGHGAIDGGVGYTYLNPQTGHEFSGVLGFTYNLKNTATQYQNGVDMHFDWGASQFLTKQVLVGLVGYVYKEVGCDSGSGDRVGCFQSQVNFRDLQEVVALATRGGARRPRVGTRSCAPSIGGCGRPWTSATDRSRPSPRTSPPRPITGGPTEVAARVVAVARQVTGDPTWLLVVLHAADAEALPAGVHDDDPADAAASGGRARAVGGGDR